MVVLLVALVVLVPLVELWVIVEVAQRFGVVETIAALLAISLVGAWIVKRQGIGVLARIRDRVAVGQVPALELVDGAMLLLAGLLLLFPGFLTSVLGLALLVPPVRAFGRWVGGWLLARRASAVVVVRRRG